MEPVAEPVPESAAQWPAHWYRLTVDFGEGVGMIPEGTCVRVLDVYAPGTPGIGADVEDSPVVQWLARAPSGRWVPRNVHFAAEAFRRLFVVAEEPPQWQEWLDQQGGG
ncbi:hypothetical protein BGM09_01095 [Streptomyces sp. CBMA29]|nr:hypothetical protein [Streptomyces sp. CBMA29]